MNPNILLLRAKLFGLSSLSFKQLPPDYAVELPQVMVMIHFGEMEGGYLQLKYHTQMKFHSVSEAV